MKIIRAEDNAVVHVVKHNDFLKRNDMSLKAKGLLSYMLSQPDGWELKINQLKISLNEGKAAIYSAIRELEAKGYIDRKRKKNQKGQYENYEYTVYEVSNVYSNTPMSENRDVECLELEDWILDCEDSQEDIGIILSPSDSDDRIYFEQISTSDEGDMVDSFGVLQAPSCQADTDYPDDLYYLQKIRDDLTYGLGVGRVYAIKDPQGYITDWKGSKAYWPSWMRSAFEFGNPNHLIKGIDDVFAGRAITPTMERILRDIVSYLRAEDERQLEDIRRENKDDDQYKISA